MNVLDYINDGLLMKDVIETLNNDYFTRLYNGLGEKLDVSNFKYNIGKDFTVATMKVKVTAKNKAIDSIEFIKKLKQLYKIHFDVTSLTKSTTSYKFLKMNCVVENYSKFNKFNKEDESVDRYIKANYSLSIYLN